MNRWVKGFLLCLLPGSLLAGCLVFAEGEDVFTKGSFQILGIAMGVVAAVYAFERFTAGRFRTAFRREAGFVILVSVCVVFVAALMLLVRWCTP